MADQQLRGGTSDFAIDTSVISEHADDPVIISAVEKLHVLTEEGKVRLGIELRGLVIIFFISGQRIGIGLLGRLLNQFFYLRKCHKDHTLLI